MSTAHISRLDKRHTHGWQVRVGEKRGYHSRLFSDRLLGGKDEALVAAKAYLAQYLVDHPQEQPAPIRFHSKITKRNKSGVVGVYRTELVNQGGVWCAYVSRGPAGQTRWNIRYRVSVYGEEEAKRLASEFRTTWEKTVVAANSRDPQNPIVAQFWQDYYYSRPEGAHLASKQVAAPEASA